MRRHNALGFSLIEVLTALALLAVLGASVVINYSALHPRLMLANATRQVLLDLRVARVQTMADNQSRRLLFGQGRAEYHRQRRTGAGFEDEGPPAALPDGIVVADCTAPNDAVAFRPRGNAISFGTVVLANTAGDTMRLVVDIAGQVRVQ